MFRIVWSGEARSDLRRLRDFLQANDVEAARRAMRTIRQSTDVLISFPGIGREIRGLPPQYREWFIRFGSGGYIIATDWNPILS